MGDKVLLGQDQTRLPVPWRSQCGVLQSPAQHHGPEHRAHRNPPTRSNGVRLHAPRPIPQRRTRASPRIRFPRRPIAFAGALPDQQTEAQQRGIVRAASVMNGPHGDTISQATSLCKTPGTRVSDNATPCAIGVALLIVGFTRVHTFVTWDSHELTHNPTGLHAQTAIPNAGGSVELDGHHMCAHGSFVGFTCVHTFCLWDAKDSQTQKSGMRIK